jgi:hypothetical protein
MIPVHTHEVDGTQALDGQQNALQFMEQTDFAKVVSYAQKPTTAAPTNNEASLQNVPIGSQPPALILVALPIGSDPAATIAQQEKGGKSVAFQGQAFVSGALQLVVGFR